MIKEDINKIYLSGYATAPPALSHTIYGEKFYKTVICARRQSGTYDCVSVTFSDKLIDIEKIYKGAYLNIGGQIRTYNMSEDATNRVSITVFAKKIEILPSGGCEDKNEIELEGYICKDMSFRVTPLGREICDVLIAVNRRFNKSDYIPIIVWGRNARYASSLKKGKHIKIIGRLQSRTYKKIIGEESEIRTAFEVSAVSIEECEYI